ncbi:hypothetical protein [Actinoplanes sp. TFC3]|uniref:hypothetical protein n=1 Tax=Actinoplanes sp. TFC3 TaxID=1710355 RepID=UPI0012901CAE|nr:hypothetical protein [Actinoplanes sp. TFC3]
MFRHRPPSKVPLPAGAVLLLTGAVVLLGACGEPPAPPESAPPAPTGSASFDPLAPPLTPPPVSVPTTGVPATTYPGVNPTYPGVTPTTTYPAYTPYTPPATQPTTTPTTPVTPTTPGPSTAPRCTSTGPTPKQLIAVVEGTAGIPDDPLKVTKGPFCSGTWQFSIMQIADESADEQLFVVTTGKPEALTLIEAGTDVCSAKVQSDAPPGIRVLACGA